MTWVAHRAWARLTGSLGRGSRDAAAPTPSAALYYNPERAEWLVEPVDVMRGRAAIHNVEARQIVPDEEADRLLAVTKAAMAACRLLEPGPAPQYRGWRKLVRKHHLIYIHQKNGILVVEPWGRQHAGAGGSYAPLVDREVRIPDDSTDDEIVVALRTALDRARSEEEAW